MAFGETVKCLASEELLGNLPFEFDAVGTVRGHGFHSLKYKIWYLIFRTVSDGNLHRCKWMIARSALSPSSSAPSVRRCAALELDRSARSSKLPRR
jgi:hypothetical protein